MARNQIDYRRALIKVRNARKDAEKAGDLSVKDLTREGVLKAKATAPFDTGLTARAVRSITRKKQDRMESEIIAPNAHRSQFANRSNPNFNLTRWMHNPRNFGHFRRARPDFMNLTREYLNRIRKKVATQRFQKIKLRYAK